MIGDDEDYVIDKESGLTYLERLKMIANAVKKKATEALGDLSELPDDEEELRF